MPARSWSNEQDALLLRLQAAGLTYALIAERINEAFGTGYDRNAVGGRIGRLRKGEGGTTRPPPIRRQRQKRKTQAPPDAPCQPKFQPVALLERTSRQCCWPINDGDPYLYCGVPKAEADRSYCPYHRWLMTPRSSRRFAGGGTP